MTRSTRNEPALYIKDLSFSYPRRSPVIKNMNLQVWPGERVGIIGPNGAGKTTLFMLICGVLKTISGNISLFGREIVPGEFRAEVGLVFQNSDDQLFCPCVQDDVAFGPKNLGLPPDQVESRVREALALTGIQELAAYPPHHLSGGQKRMVAIAGVLAMYPDLVIYDEPTSNLDINYRRRLIGFLQQSRETMLIASHDLEFILEVCDRVILLDGGRIAGDGKPAEIMGDVRLMQAHSLEKPHSLVPHTELHHRAAAR